MPFGCVDPEDLTLRGTVDIIVVDGAITNLAEPQIIRLNRSKADPLTGRFGTVPLTKATVEVVVDSLQIASCHETIDGSYQLPSDFRGQIGHTYQLRFTLADGTRYVSTQQMVPAVPPIEKIYAQFNPKSLSPALSGFYTAGHDISVDVTDPVEQHNYYRWDWKLYEPQEFCRTCVNSFYSVFNPIEVFPTGGFYKSGTESFEDCFHPPYNPTKPISSDYKFDYVCRTKCWEILYSYSLNLFDDQFTNGGLIAKRKVAAIPFYQHRPCLVEIRQGLSTKDAYRYYKLVQNQTKNTGGLADTPPTALIGNIHNVADPRETVIGYFATSVVSVIHQCLNRKDAVGRPFGASDPAYVPQSAGEELFFALNLRGPMLEPEPNNPGSYKIFVDNTSRPPTAICAPSESRTPFKPAGWRD